MYMHTISIIGHMHSVLHLRMYTESEIFYLPLMYPLAATDIAKSVWQVLGSLEGTATLKGTVGIPNTGFSVVELCMSGLICKRRSSAHLFTSYRRKASPSFLR